MWRLRSCPIHFYAYTVTEAAACNQLSDLLSWKVSPQPPEALNSGYWGTRDSTTGVSKIYAWASRRGMPVCLRIKKQLLSNMIINWWMKIDEKHLYCCFKKCSEAFFVIESILRPHGGSAPWSEVGISASTHLLIVQFQGRWSKKSKTFYGKKIY